MTSIRHSDLAFHEEAHEPRAHKSLQEYVDQVQKAQKERLFDFSVRKNYNEVFVALK